MAARRTNKPSKFERCYRILEYLKWNTDPEHTVSQANLRKVPELKKYIPYKETLNDCITTMAEAMNTGVGEAGDSTVKPEEEWRLVFDEYRRQYGTSVDEEEDEDEPDRDGERMRIRNLYYQHPFTYDEVNAIVEGILFSRTLDSDAANRLIEKIEQQLATKFYRKGSKNICRVHEPKLTNRRILRESLVMIQTAIDDRVKIAFHFCAYNRKKQLEILRKKKDVVSPYYIVANNGSYYLLAGVETREDGRTQARMFIYRIDLMRDVEIPDRDEAHGKKGIRAPAKEKVRNLPQQWDEEFQLSHLNMAFDQPVTVTLRIRIPDNAGNPGYTFLHDWFGDTFRHVRTETEPPYDEIVKVKCSPYAMVHWALQYSDRVEVLEPESVRQAIAEKVKDLNNKYMGGQAE